MYDMINVFRRRYIYSTIDYGEKGIQIMNETNTKQILQPTLNIQKKNIVHLFARGFPLSSSIRDKEYQSVEIS